MNALLSHARRQFHLGLIESQVLSVDAAGNPSNADKSQKSSVALARGVLVELGLAVTPKAKLKGQTAGRLFEEGVATFLRETLPTLRSVRPADWEIENVGSSRSVYHLASYVPYVHLDSLARAVERDPTLKTVLGNSYDISPDVIVSRRPVPDEAINADVEIVDARYGTRSPLRAANQTRPIVHAVISCKWTLRSDRAQNARSEALGIIRNRKGRAPHIAVVTGEPSPSRLASLALGTGDIDTMYHIALPELIASAQELDNDEALQMLMTLVDGHRLRDLSDLPLDLVI